VKYVYEKYFIFFLFFITIHYQLYTGEEIKNKRISLIFSDQKTMDVEVSVFETSEFFQPLLHKFQGPGQLCLRCISYEDFEKMLPVMKYSAENKIYNLNLLYKNSKMSELIQSLITADYLAVSLAQQIIIKNIAQRYDCDAINNNFSDKKIKKLNISLFGRPHLFKSILSMMTVFNPVIIEEKITVQDQNVFNQDRCILSPGKKVKYSLVNDQETLRLVSDDKIIYQLPRHNSSFYFQQDCVFAANDSYMICEDLTQKRKQCDLRSCFLINLKNPTQVQLTATVQTSWDITKTPLFNTDGTLLFTAIYDFNNNQQAICNIIDTSSGKSIKSFLYNDYIDDIFFYAPNKLFLSGKDVDNNTHSITLIDIDSPTINVFNDIQVYKFNGKDIIAWYSHDGDGKGEITIAVGYAPLKKIKLDEFLTNVSIFFNRDNDTVLVTGKNLNNTEEKFVLCCAQEEKSGTVFSVQHSTTAIQWSPTGDYIFYESVDSVKGKTFTFFNINDKTQHVLSSEYFANNEPQSFLVHPLHDIVYFVTDTKLYIYNMRKKTIVADHKIYNINFRRSLIYDKKLLYFHSNKTSITIINAITGCIVFSFEGYNSDLLLETIKLNYEDNKIIFTNNDGKLLKVISIKSSDSLDTNYRDQLLKINNGLANNDDKSLKIVSINFSDSWIANYTTNIIIVNVCLLGSFLIKNLYEFIRI